MSYPETLFLVYDQKPKILELHILGQHPMGTDHDIHHALLQIRHCLFYLGRRSEPAHQLHPDRKVLHPLHESVVMLLGKNGGGYQVHYLLVFLNSLKGSPDSNLRLAIPHISANQTVHNLTALHVRFRLGYGIQLILCLLKRKHLLKFPLPHSVLVITIA